MENIQLKGIKCAYGDRTILDNVNISIDEGMFVLVCGPTGSGKSTLLKHLKKQLGDRAAFVSQNPDNGIVCDRVYAELEFNLKQLGVEEHLIKARVAECAGYFGISRWLQREVSTLSGGEKQILNIASAMTVGPEILLLDEPTAMLDPVMTDRIIDMLLKLNREYGITIVISEHKPESLYGNADRVIYVSDRTAVGMDRDDMAKRLIKDERTRGFLPTAARLLGNEDYIPYTVAQAKQLLSKKSIELSGMEKETKEQPAVREAACTGAVDKKALRAAEEVLSLRDVYFAYEKTQPVLKGISFDVKAGEVVTLMGENGCGKSSAALVAAGAKRPYSGKVKRESCAMLFQDVLLHFTKDSYDGRHPYDLSAGERQKLALSLVLGRKPRLLILDEPSKGLDPWEKKSFMKEIMALSDEGIGILIITHDIELAYEYSDRIMLMHDGVIAEEGAPEEFCRDNLFYTPPIKKIMGGGVCL